jgi:hypothetical protein
MQDYFSHPSLIMYFFSNPTHTTKIVIANKWETNDSKTFGPITMSYQSKIWKIIKSYLLHYFLVGVKICCAFLLVLANCAKMLGHNHFVELNQYG